MAKKKKPPSKFKSFRKVLSECLNETDETPATLASYLRCSSSYVYSMIAGEKIPSFSVTKDIARYFGSYCDEFYILKAFAADYFRSNKEAKDIAKVAIDSGILK